MTFKNIYSFSFSLAVFVGGITPAMANNAASTAQGCWDENGTMVCLHPVDDSVEQRYSHRYDHDDYGAYVAFGRADGTEAILMLEPHKVSLASSRYFCYIACEAFTGADPASIQQKVGLIKILGYYDASRTCQPMTWPASGLIEHHALNNLCASRFKDMVPNAQKWRGSGDTFFWMLHTEDMIHLQ